MTASRSGFLSFLAGISMYVFFLVIDNIYRLTKGQVSIKKFSI